MLKQRVLTALVLLPLMFGMLFYASDPVWAMFCGLISLLILWEIARMAKFPAMYIWLYPALGAAVLAFCYFFGANLGRLPLLAASILLFWMVAVPAWLARGWHMHRLLDWAALGLVLVVPFWMALVSLRALSSLSLLCIMGLIWVADSGAYAFGRLWGKHKLAPSISPGKSWEGVLGGLACVLLYTVLVVKMGWFATRAPLWGVLVVATLLTVMSIIGDLFESWLKRCAGIKDSSNLLPGHGGVFDRTDSMISVLSVVAALFTWAAFK